jgi:hypothetical protein
MGTSAGMTKKHYKRAVPKLEAGKFWALRPQRPNPITGNPPREVP